MDPHRSKEEELRRREEAIKEREIQIRMRELEAELDPTPVTPTTKHQEPRRKGWFGRLQDRSWYKRLTNFGKFCLVVIAVIVAVRLATWLATAVLIGGVAWVGYKLFLEGDRD